MEKKIKKCKIEFTSEEAQVLINIINIAVMSKGLEITESALYLSNKIQKEFSK